MRKLIIFILPILCLVLLSENIFSQEAKWATNFGPTGVDGTVYGIIQWGDSTVIAGNITGLANNAGYTSEFMIYDNIDKSWHFVKNGPDGEIRAMAVNDNGDLILAGDFTLTYAGKTMDDLTVYGKDGSWNTVSGNTTDGLPSTVIHDIVWHNSKLYLGGEWSVFGLSIFVWDSSFGFQVAPGTFDPFQSASPIVYDLEMSTSQGDKLFIGGDFFYNGSFGPSVNVVSLDVNSLEYEEIPVMPNGPVYSLFTYPNQYWENKIAIGGDFSEFDVFDTMPQPTQQCDNFFVFDFSDSTYQVSSKGPNGPIYSITLYDASNSVILLGGAFDTVGTEYLGPVVYWNHSSDAWIQINPDIDGNVYALGEIIDSRFLAGGSFDYIADSALVNNVVHVSRTFPGSDWSPLGDGLVIDGSTFIHNNDVSVDSAGNAYVVGNFTHGGGTRLNHIGKWNIDDEKWEALGDGLTGYAEHVQVRRDRVYIAGSTLTEASGVPVNQIAVWHDSAWHALGEGVPGANILDMVFDTLGNLYVCGSGLDSAGTVSAAGIAKWNGVSWETVGEPLSGSSPLFIFDMHLDSATNHIYVCGQFDAISNPYELSSGVAIWDGTAWIASETPQLRDSGQPRVITTNQDGKIIIAGTYGSNDIYEEAIVGAYPFASTGDFVGGIPNTILTAGCDMFIAGEPISDMNGVPVRNLARHDGSEWNDVDSGTNGHIFSLDKHNENLYVAGKFKQVGNGEFAQGFAIWNGLSTGSTNSGISIVRPTGTDTAYYGEIFEIKWDTSTTVELMSVEISYDSGQTWQYIHNRADAKFGKLTWLVPDTTLDFCKIRISDYDAPCSYDESALFSIVTDTNLEVTWLTRAGGTYYTEPFTVGFHTWGWSNTKENVWPDSLEDNSTYSEGFTTVADTIINFPHWQVFQEAFGDDYCLTSNGTIKLKALKKWESILTKWGGSCLGFSKSSMLWWKYNEFNTDIILPYDYLNTFEKDYFAIKSINKHWIYQKGKKHIKQGDDVLEYSPMQTLNAIKNSLETNDPRTLSFSYRDWKDKLDEDGVAVDSIWKKSSHNVAPYAVKNHTDSIGIYKIYVYDSNAPTSRNRFFRVDSVNNLWSYPASNIADTNSRFVPRLPITEYIGLANDDVISVSQVNGLKVQASQNIIISTSATEEILITDSAGGQIGWMNNDDINTIDGSSSIYPDDPDYPYYYPQGYFLPEGSYQVELSNFDYSKTRLFIENSTSTHTYQRKSTDSSQTDNILFDTGITVLNSDPTAKKVSVSSVVTNNEKEYYVQIDSLDIFQNDSTILEVSPLGVVSIDNFGQQKDYTIILRYSDNITESFTQSITTISLGANSSQKIEPNWTNLESGSLEIQIDADMDGTFEDTVVADVATDISDDLGSVLPDSYNLAQNYPNPFNPSTTISFNLPTKSTVQLEILNILGQKVKTLIDKSLAAGEHQFVWDGTTSSGAKVGTGVYFYRLTADNFVSTKKMLLLK